MLTPQRGALDWAKPNMVVLHIDPPGRVFKNAVACVPVDERTTRMVLIGRHARAPRAAGHRRGVTAIP